MQKLSKLTNQYGEMKIGSDNTIKVKMNDGMGILTDTIMLANTTLLGTAWGLCNMQHMQ